MPLDPTKPPSGNFALEGWRLTLPSGDDDGPDVISARRLTNGYRSLYFHTGADGAMVFRCPVNGVTTRCSHNPRCELREAVTTGGDHVLNWRIGQGTAELRATLAVREVTNSRKVVVGQILRNVPPGSTTSGGPLLEIEYQRDPSTGKFEVLARIRLKPTSNLTSTIVATDISLGTKFEYLVRVRSDGSFELKIDGVVQYQVNLDPIWKSEDLNFQAGAYVDDDGSGAEAEVSEISFYALVATHS